MALASKDEAIEIIATTLIFKSAEEVDEILILAKEKAKEIERERIQEGAGKLRGIKEY